MLDRILSDRGYPFGTVLFIITIPINLVFLFGGIFAEAPFYYDGLVNLIPVEFVIFNFVITLCGLFLVIGGREWNGSCF